MDLTKTFDTVCRGWLLGIMAKFVCHAKFIAMVCPAIPRRHVRVQDKRKNSRLFPVTNGIKQGCVLPPTLFSMVLSAILMDAFRYYGGGDVH